MKLRIAIAGAVVASVGGVVVASLLRSTGNGPRITQDSIVMLGDSITAQGDWSQLLPAEPLVNEGRSGFTTEQLIAVAEQVADAEPAAVVVLTGTNDIRDGHPASWTREHLDRLIDRIEQRSASTTIVVQTVFPRADARAEVRQVNAEIRGLAEQRGLRLLDLYEPFDDGTGALRRVETYDGLHLTVEGYERWADVLRPVLHELGSSGDSLP